MAKSLFLLGRFTQIKRSTNICFTRFEPEKPQRKNHPKNNYNREPLEIKSKFHPIEK